MKSYICKIYSGNLLSKTVFVILAPSYDAAVNRLGIMPPGYIWSIEPVLTLRARSCMNISG